MKQEDIKTFLETALRGEEPRYHRLTIDSETHITYRLTNTREPQRFWGHYLVLEADNGLVIRNGPDSMKIPPCAETYDFATHAQSTPQGYRIAHQRHALRLNELLLISIRDLDQIRGISKTHSRA